MMDFESTVTGLMHQCNWDRATAERNVRERLRDQVTLPAPPANEDDRRREREKLIEHRGDQLMIAHGFTAIRLSQPRATKQTPGIPDRRYYRAPRVVRNGQRADFAPSFALWWDAKTVAGQQSSAQREFQQLVESCGETYLVGTDDVLRSYLVERGLWIPTGP